MRWSSISVRALHQLAAALFTAGAVTGVSAGRGWLLAAVGTGVVLTALEIERRRGFAIEMTGGVTVAKLLLIGLAFHGLLPVVPTVTAAFLVASVGSHAPKGFRHRSLLLWRKG